MGQQRQSVGLAKSPGETPHEFVFVSPDKDQTLKVGEFVIYKADIDGQPRDILARVTQRRPLRLYPDTFFSDPSMDPDNVAALIGYRSRRHEHFEITATIIGYYDETLGDFTNPRIPPRSGHPIYMGEDADLSRMLCKRRSGETGAAHIGSLLSRDVDRVPITIDLRAVTSTHLAIIANTGAGKSYLAAVLIEEMMKPTNRAAVLIVDPHGEYDSLVEIMNQEVFAEGLLDETGYRPEVKVFRPGDVKVRASALDLGDLYYLLPSLSDRMEHLLRRAYREVRDLSAKSATDPARWTRDMLKQRLTALGRGREEEDGDGDSRNASTAEALIWRLETVLESSIIFDDFQHLSLTDLFQPGRCSILQLNEVDEREQQVMVATLLRILFDARKKTIKGQVSKNDDLYLPYPAFVLIEEAHHFAPVSGDVISAGILKQILAEGRKFGVGVGLISQRPGKLDADVLSQCNTQFILRIVNPTDQARVAESVESVGRDLLRELPSLTKGQVIVAGEAVNTPVLCRVRTRHTPHGAESRDAPAEWIQFFGPEEQSRRAREAALPIQHRRRTSKMYK